MHDLHSGKVLQTFDLPPCGSVHALSGEEHESIFTSYLDPPCLFTCDVEQSVVKPKIFRNIKLPELVDLSQIQQEQVFYKSADGTSIPMVVVRHKDVALDSSSTWYHAGRLEKKQNCFDDFIAAGEYLIEKKYTCKEKLFIRGGSNGGLLVAACANQRPDLFGAVIPMVPVTDLLRFHRFTIGYAWISDFGNPENPEHFKFIKKYVFFFGTV
ncbi:hypothetical protein Ciccas_005054 [Cichlidogyrus casuarinus]|uniref:Prolyl endopeptidase n=1 Tax=Cichlidogyrus casuarinus TaxID=1844966 RepID=A0ABD2Q9U5_9PLAT